jgi:DNA repair exonuclease SbcCD ATPase subunit
MYIGPESKVIFHRLQIKTDDDHVSTEGTSGSGMDEEKTLSQVIVKLKESLNKKDKRISELEAEVRSIAGKGVADTTILRLKMEAEAKLLSCTRELENLKYEKQSLERRVSLLQEFKDLIKSSENGDVIINLTNLTASQKAQIESIQSDLSNQKSQYEQLKKEKTELQNIIKLKNEENDKFRNEQVVFLQQMIEKDSAISAMENEIKVLKDSLSHCCRDCKKKEREKEKREKKAIKKEEGSQLFDE